MKELSAQLRRLSTGQVTMVMLLIFIVFMVLILPSQSNRELETRAGSATPDLSLFCTPEELYQMAETFGPGGRKAFILARWTFDVAWPMVYSIFLVTSISWLVGRGFPSASRWQFTKLVPILAADLIFLRIYPIRWWWHVIHLKLWSFLHWLHS